MNGTEALAQYGALGIITALLIVFARFAYMREVERANRLEAFVQDKVIPALLSATRAIEQTQELLNSQRGRKRYDDE